MNDRTLEPEAARVHRGTRQLAIAGLAALSLALGACSGENKPKSASQTVARVNGTEITVHQVNNELARMGAQGGADNKAAAKRVLEALIDQQLLVQQAIDAKLDRDPKVMQALEQARRQLLSQAYLERNLSAPRPSPEEVTKFYADNPALFEKRRIYSFRDFAIERPQYSEALRAKLDPAKTPADVAATLKTMNINYQEGAGARGAEQLPLEMLSKISAMGKGDIAVLTGGDRVILMQLIDSTEKPITLAQATPYIEQYLTNNRKKQLAESKLKDMRAAAKITYVGEFQQGDGPQNPQDSPKAETPGRDASKESGAGHDESLQKGLKELVR